MPFGRQHPLGHFAITAVGEVCSSGRHQVFDALSQRDDFQPLAIVLQELEEFPQPTFFEDGFFRPGPGSELLAVVAEDRDRIRIAFELLAQNFDRLVDVVKRDGVSQRF